MLLVGYCLAEVGRLVCLWVNDYLKKGDFLLLRCCLSEVWENVVLVGYCLAEGGKLVCLFVA